MHSCYSVYHLVSPSSFDVGIKCNITIKVCVSGILLGGNFVLMAYFSIQSVAIYACTLDIADLSEEEVNAVTVPRTLGRQ